MSASQISKHLTIAGAENDEPETGGAECYNTHFPDRRHT